MKNFITKYLALFLVTISLNAQDTLNFDWEATVLWGAYGQRTVVADTLLFHVGGRTRDLTLPANGIWDSYSLIEYFDEDNGYWVGSDQSLKSRAYINAEYFDNKIYVVGGAAGGETASAEMEIYDIETNSVSAGTPIPTGRRAAGSTIVDGKIYVAGGQTDAGYTSNFEVYDVATNSWSSLSPILVATETELTSYNNKIYMVGGYNGTIQDKVYEYDIATDTWQEISTMPHPTSAHKLAVYQGNIFSIGDYVDLNRIMKYNIENNTWTEYSSNLIGRRHASAAILNNRLYYVAGNSYLNSRSQYYNIVQSIDLTDLVTSAPGEIGLNPVEFNLEQNYPNPFNPSTTISFSLPSKSDVELKVFDSLGQLVQTLISENLASGSHRFDFSASHLASGIYMYQLSIDNKFVQTKKMVLTK